MHDLPSRGDACGRRRPARFDGGAERWRRRSPGPRVRRRPRRVTAVDAMRCLRRHERRAVFPQAVDPTGAVALAGDPGRAPDAAYRRADTAPDKLATFQGRNSSRQLFRRLAALAPSVGSDQARAVTPFGFALPIGDTIVPASGPQPCRSSSSSHSARRAWPGPPSPARRRYGPVTIGSFSSFGRSALAARGIMRRGLPAVGLDIDPGADDAPLVRVGHREARRVAELRGTGLLVSLDSRVVVVVAQELPRRAPPISSSAIFTPLESVLTMSVGFPSR